MRELLCFDAAEVVCKLEACLATNLFVAVDLVMWNDTP